MYLGFGTIRGFSHPLRVLDRIPADKGDYCKRTDSSPPISGERSSPQFSEVRVHQRGNRTMAQSTATLTSKGPHHVPGTFGYHPKHRTNIPKKRPHEEGLVGLVEKESYPGFARVSELRQSLSFSEANSTFPLAGDERDSEQQPGG